MEKYEEYVEERLGKLDKLPKKLQKVVRDILDDVFSTSYVNTYTVERKLKDNNILDHFGKDENDFRKIIEFLFSKEHLSFYDYIKENGNEFSYTVGYYRRSYRDLSVNSKGNEAIVSLVNLFDSMYKLESGVNLASKMPETDEEYYFIINSSPLFTAYLIDSNDEKIINLVKETIISEKNTQIVGYSLIRGVMYSKNQELVELLGNLLIAAQRQEGLRQQIVENADCGRIENFVYFIKLIIDNDLIRFNSVIRAMGVWANMTNIDTIRPKLVEKIINTMYYSIIDEEKRKKYLDSDDKTEIYLGLWGEGVHDISKIDEKIKSIIDKKDDYKTVVAACFLNTITREKVSDNILYKILELTDSYEVVAWISVILNLSFDYSVGYKIVDKLEPIRIVRENDPEITEELAKLVFKKYMILFDRLKGKSGSLQILDTGIEGNILTVYRETIEEGLFIAGSKLGDEKVDELMKLVSSGKTKKAYLNNYAYKLRNEQDREFLMDCLGNSREANLQKQARVYIDLLKIKFTSEEILSLENMLRLKTPDSRNIALDYLGNQKPEEIYNSIDRLLSTSKLENRLGGLDLAVNKITSKDQVIYKKLEKRLKEHKVKSPAEQVLIDKFLQGENKESLYSLENGLGFYTEKDEISLPNLEEKLDFDLKKDLLPMPYKEFKKYADKLNKLFEDNINTSYQTTYYDGTTSENILGSYASLKKPVRNFEFEHINHVEIDELDNLYLAEVWREFFKQNDIPMEFIYELNYLSSHGYSWGNIDENIIDKMLKMSQKDLLKDKDYNDETKMVVKLLPIKDILKKLDLFKVENYSNQYYFKAKWVRLDRLDEILAEYKKTKAEDSSEDLFNRAKKVLHKLYLEIPNEYYSKDVYYSWSDKTSQENIISKLGSLAYFRFTMSENIGDKDDRLRDYLVVMNSFLNKSMEINSELKNSFQDKFITVDDVARGYEKGLLSSNYFYKYALSSNLIRQFTKSNLYYGEKEYFRDKYPKGNELVKKLVDRMVDIEIDRGDTQTIVSGLVANNVENYQGVDYFVRLLSRLDYKETFARNVDNYWGIDEKSRKSMISGLIKRNGPGENEDIEDFEKLLKGKKIPIELLVDVAMYNEKWTDIICEYIGWQGLKSAIWYFRAHTGEFPNGDEKEKIGKEISKYSPVSLEDFEEGVFDIEWFKLVYDELGKKKFEVVYNSAKYISSNAKHKRAQTYSDAALGKLKITEIEKSIKDKRNQLSVRAYGVIPIKKNREKDILNRYKKLQGFLKESKQFGAQRQASEKKSIEIAMENLAKNAGYKDVTTLSLVLESQISDDLLKYFEDVKIGDYDLKIVNEKLGTYKIVAKKDDKQLKSIPAKIKKDKNFKEMSEALKNVRDQYSRSIKSFENMMNRETEISVENIVDIMSSQIFYPMFENIVFMKDEAFGYIKDDSLIGADGKKIKLKDGEKIKVAHPYNLYEKGVWSDFQKDIFKRGVVQPFKQVFRELYLPNEDELEMGESLRYAGHQLQGNKLFGLMKARGWISGGESIYYNYNIYAKLFGIADYFSPSDIGEPVLELVRFYDIKTREFVLVKDVPAIMFSEIMRDIDLFVSVAYVGGVDPEASLSTIEMRGVIVRELLDIMKIKNAVIDDKFVRIEGIYGSYNVHLGSGSVQMAGRGSINILAVHSDSRGKLFLPFVDEDPKTAEIVSKVLLLSKDDEIKDATIVDQIK